MDDLKIVTLEFGRGTCLQDLTGKLNTYRLANNVVNMGCKPLGGCFVVLKLSTEELRSLPGWLGGAVK